MHDNAAPVTGKTPNLGPRSASTAAPETAVIRSLRAHDAWALDLEPLLRLLHAEITESDLPISASGVLLANDGRLQIITSSDLNEEQKQRVIRTLLGRFIGTQAPGHEESKDAATPKPTAPHAVSSGASASSAAYGDEYTETGVLELYEQHQEWSPLHGWRTDREVIASLRALITETLAGVAEEYDPAEVGATEGVGAAMCFGYDSKGTPHPIVYVRSDLPPGLRADLWGFCVAVASGADMGEAEPDDHGIFYIGTQRTPVTRPGAGLLAALIVHRMGRRPGDCAFEFVDAHAMQGRTEQPDSLAA